LIAEDFGDKVIIPEESEVDQEGLEEAKIGESRIEEAEHRRV
jgi:hypothetical protein